MFQFFLNKSPFIGIEDQADRRLQYFQIILLLLISSRASVLSTSDVVLVLALLLSILIFSYNELQLDRGFIILTLGYLGLTFIYLMQFGYVNVSSSFRLYLKLLYGYLVFRNTRDNFFELFEDIVVKLALISLPLFAFQIIDLDDAQTLNSLLQNTFPFLEYAGESSNSFVFTININGLNRNSGFAWEPGGFAAFLSIAMMLNLTFNRFRFNRRLVILLIAMLTTLSTTGYLLVVIVGLYVLWNLDFRYRFLLVPVFAAAAIYISTLDFVSNKIETQINTRTEVFTNIRDYKHNEFTSLGRFGSMMVDLNDFKDHYIFGVGLQEDERTQSSYTRLQRTNGLSFYLVMFGSVGIVFLCYSISQGFRLVCRKYLTKGWFVFTLVIFTLAFSNPVLDTPFFLALQTVFFGANWEQEELTA